MGRCIFLFVKSDLRSRLKGYSQVQRSWETEKLPQRYPYVNIPTDPLVKIMAMTKRTISAHYLFFMQGEDPILIVGSEGSQRLLRVEAEAEGAMRARTFALVSL